MRWLVNTSLNKNCPSITQEDLRQAPVLCQSEYSYKAVRGKDCLPYVQPS